jgi:hypothetical protein
MEDDLDKRIADLEGRGPDSGISEQNPFEDPEALRHGVVQWIREHWMVIAIAVLTVLGASLTKLSSVFPAMNEPAPHWVGAVFLALPFTAMAIYFVVRFIKSRR